MNVKEVMPKIMIRSPSGFVRNHSETNWREVTTFRRISKSLSLFHKYEYKILLSCLSAISNEKNQIVRSGSNASSARIEQAGYYGFGATAVLSLVPIVVNVVPSVLPRLPTPATMATEMRAAIRPYSIAVAPDSSLRKRVKRVVMFCIPVEALPLTRFR